MDAVQRLDEAVRLLRQHLRRLVLCCAECSAKVMVLRGRLGSRAFVLRRLSTPRPVDATALPPSSAVVSVEHVLQVLSSVPRGDESLELLLAGSPPCQNCGGASWTVRSQQRVLTASTAAKSASLLCTEKGCKFPPAVLDTPSTIAVVVLEQTLTDSFEQRSMMLWIVPVATACGHGPEARALSSRCPAHAGAFPQRCVLCRNSIWNSSQALTVKGGVAHAPGHGPWAGCAILCDKCEHPKLRCSAFALPCASCEKIAANADGSSKNNLEERPNAFSRMFNPVPEKVVSVVDHGCDVLARVCGKRKYCDGWSRSGERFQWELDCELSREQVQELTQVGIILPLWRVDRQVALPLDNFVNPNS
jgi:hypothetical protein